MNHPNRRYSIAVLIAVLISSSGCSRLAARKQSDHALNLGNQCSSPNVYDRETFGAGSANLQSSGPLRPRGGPQSSLSSTGDLGPVAQDPLVEGERTNISKPDAIPNGSSVVVPGASLQKVVADAREGLDRLRTYQVELNRQERIDGNLQEPENLTMSVLRSPKAVRLTWADGSHRGREVMYRSDENPQVLHVNMADSKFPLPRMKLPIDSPMVLKNSRHPISEAGFETILESLEAAVSDPGSSNLHDLGESSQVIEGKLVRGIERRMPSGERWNVYIDTETHLPALVECFDGNGQLLERNRFSRLESDPLELSRTEAFNPDLRWGAAKSLFGRTSK